MGVTVMWQIEGRARARCMTYEDRPPMVDLSDRAGFSLTLGPSVGDWGSAESAAFARELAVATWQYAQEWARWAGTSGADGSGEPSSALGIPEEALTAAGAAFLAELERATARTPTGDPRPGYPDEVVAAAVAGAAPVVVACELRRLAAEVWAGAGADRYGWVWALRARADELDPDGAGIGP